MTLTCRVLDSKHFDFGSHNIQTHIDQNLMPWRKVFKSIDKVLPWILVYMAKIKNGNLGALNQLFFNALAKISYDKIKLGNIQTTSSWKSSVLT